MNYNHRGNTAIAVLCILGVVALLAFIAFVMYVMPQYRVYSQRKEGEAQLAHAQFSKEVAVAEAKAKMESASLLADAEVLRAHGVAKANEIIGKSLQGNESYLRYLWIMEVAHNDVGKTVVYIPTEANLPILEAVRTGK